MFKNKHTFKKNEGFQNINKDTNKKIVKDNDEYIIDIWDTAGQERYRALMPMYYRNSDLILANQLDLESEDISKDELVYERNNKKYYANEAIVESIYDLGSFYKGVKLLKLFPAIFSYKLYKIFARNRYRFN